jgi:hypothetical protein
MDWPLLLVLLWLPLMLLLLPRPLLLLPLVVNR